MDSVARHTIPRRKFTPRRPKHVDLTAEQIFGAPIESIIRLARWMGVPIDHLLDKPDAKWRIAAAIVRWNKKHPQPREK